jgi:hypothetical protein
MVNLPGDYRRSAALSFLKLIRSICKFQNAKRSIESNTWRYASAQVPQHVEGADHTHENAVIVHDKKPVDL